MAHVLEKARHASSHLTNGFGHRLASELHCFCHVQHIIEHGDVVHGAAFEVTTVEQHLLGEFACE